MILLQSVTEISNAESLALLALIGGAAFLYYRAPSIPAGGHGFLHATTTGNLRVPRYACGPNCVECPHCGVENDSVYRFCQHCTEQLHPA